MNFKQFYDRNSARRATLQVTQKKEPNAVSKIGLEACADVAYLLYCLEQGQSIDEIDFSAALEAPRCRVCEAS